MRRVCVLALAGLLSGGAALAQPREKVFRLGALLPTAAALDLVRDHTVPELAKLGFVEGRNLVLDARVGDFHRLPALARELVATRPDAIIALANPATAAAKEATGTIPIVMNAADPIELGFAKSLARPGMNVTGTVMLGPELDRKRLQLLHEAAPGLWRLAMLVTPAMHLNLQARKRDIEHVAAGSSLELLFFEAATPDAYAPAFAAMRAADAGVLLIGSDPQFRRDAPILARLAMEATLPTICNWRDMAQAGCLLSYGPSAPELFRRMAEHVARVFAGGDPAEMPIEGPTKFEFVVNMKTAKAIGLTVPDSVLLQADEVIE